MIFKRWLGQFIVILFLSLTCLGLSSVAQSDTLPSDAPVLQAYRLGVDDRLKVTVYREENLTDSYVVASDGTISMPLIGTVSVLNLTVSDVEDLVIERLLDGYLIDPSVSIEVESYRPFYILGEVNVPGRYDYVNHMTALKAVALAGGFTYRARQKYVKVMRGESGDDEYQTIKLIDLVMPGDVLLVEERFF